MGDLDAISRFIAAVGFPIACAIALAIILYRLGLLIVRPVARNIDAATEAWPVMTQALKETRAEVAEIKAIIPGVCKADCPNERECENYKPKQASQRSR